MTPRRRTIHRTTRTTGDLTVRHTRPGRPKVQEAVEARDALATALSRAGIQLPAMDVRTPWREILTDGEGEPGTSARYALVHLGVCSAPVAMALAAVITKGSGR